MFNDGRFRLDSQLRVRDTQWSAVELFGAPGVGYEIITSANNLAMDRGVAYMLAISAVFLASDRGVRRLEARFLRWQAWR